MDKDGKRYGSPLVSTFPSVELQSAPARPIDKSESMSPTRANTGTPEGDGYGTVAPLSLKVKPEME